MADQERNFRTHYYEKVGFRAVEEKKSIEILLKEQPIRKDKLLQFSLRFGIPAMYRTYVWKILLGILPANQASQAYVLNHRQEQVKELERALVLLCPEYLCGSQEQKILRMKLIEDGKLPLQNKFLDTDISNQYFVCIAQAVGGLVSSEVDLYWISTRFYRHIKDNFYKHVSQFPEHTMQCLKKEEEGKRLYQHLYDYQVVDELPLNEWFHTCYANVLPDNSLERIWDRVIGGSSEIFLYVAVAVLLVLRRPLLAMQSAHDIANYLKQIPEDCGDKIVNEALTLLHKHSGQHPPKPDSPSTDSGKNLVKPADRNTSNKPTLTKTQYSSIDGSSSTEKIGKNVLEKSVSVDIGRRSPNDKFIQM